MNGSGSPTLVSRGADRQPPHPDGARTRTTALQSSTLAEARMIDLIQHLTEGVVHVSPDGRILECNAEAARLLGRARPQELRGRYWSEEAPTFPLPKGTEGCPPEEEWWVEDARARVRGRAGCLPDGGFLVSLRDVTELRGLEAQFSEAQKMESVGRLTGGIAHDFRNLLTVIRVNVSLLLEETPGENPHRKHLEEMKRATERGGELVARLMAHSRPGETRLAPLDLREVVDEIHPLVDRAVGDHIRLVVKQADEPLGVMADPVRVEQILLNLVTNARDAMPRGGRLMIFTEEVELDAAYCRDNPEATPGRYARLSVRDTGHGMPRGIRNHIFEPFFTTKGSGEGTGLGLPTVLRIVRNLGGHLWVYSEPDQGTVVRICLPLVELPAADGRLEEGPPAAAGTEAAAPVPAQAPAQAPAEPDDSPATVLLVEDEPAIRTVLQQIMERKGIRVLPAGSGEDALDLARDFRGRLDCLLTDLNLPGLDGIEIGRAVRRMHPDTRIVVMSGYGEEELEPGLLQALDADFLEKPFPPDRLVELMRSVTSNGASAPGAVR